MKLAQAAHIAAKHTDGRQQPASGQTISVWNGAEKSVREFFARRVHLMAHASSSPNALRP